MAPGTVLVAQGWRHNWRVTQINGQAITSASGPRVPTLAFDAKATISGNSSCNGYSANYQLKGSQIPVRLGHVDQARLRASVEDEFFAALQATRSLRSSGQQLLQDANGVVSLARD